VVCILVQKEKLLFLAFLFRVDECANISLPIAEMATLMTKDG
jgi:hypothetical protein